MPPAQRTARYRCAMVYLRGAHDAAPLIAQAAWDGRILRAPAGVRGFGYDPHLRSSTGAGVLPHELDPPEKNRGQSPRARRCGCSLLALPGLPRASNG